MTNDEILQAAKDAGFEFKPLPRDLYCEVWLEQLERFTKIIERKTIERCAYVAEQGPDESEWTDDAVISSRIMELCREAPYARLPT